mmetsp:Transcript_8016/g.18415  ORF Transcript_8016/g.18415 Transcript_8016/m.18415 type:complete len:401 (-) Transcript_8016:28-1230(-)
MAQRALWKPRIAARLLNIPGSGIREVMSKSAALREAGKDVINWHIGRPDFDTPGHIKEACSAALRDGHVHYTPAAGIPQLREALAERATQEYGCAPVDPDRVVVCNGGMEAVSVILHSFLEDGDEVIVPTPNWPNMKWAIAMAGGCPVEVPLTNGILTAEAIDRAVTHRTKFVVLSSPSNPLGTVTSVGELKQISRVLEDKDLLAISDETYTRLSYACLGSCAPSILSIKGMQERCFATSTFSKTYAMDGWRLGWALCPDAEAAVAVAKTRYYYSSCSPTFTQYAGVAALSLSQDCVLEMVSQYNERRSILVEGLQRIPGVKLPGGSPEGAYYVFPDISSFGDSAEIARYLLDEHHIAVVDGGVFGAEGQGHIRIAYSCSSEDCSRGVERLAGALRTLSH